MVGPMLGLMAFTGDMPEITEEMDLALAGAKASGAGIDEARRLLGTAALAPRDEANSRAITGAAAMIEKAPSFLETAVREMAKIKRNSKKLHPKLQALDAELASLQGKLPELTALAARVKALHGF